MKNFKIPYTPRERVTLATGRLADGKGAKQQFKNECNINNILKKYRETGIPPQVTDAARHYGDFATVTDYQTAVNSVMSAEAAFAALPSNVRKRFDNSPEALIGFVSDANNLDEAIALGLVAKPPEASPIVPDETPIPTSKSKSSKQEV